MFKTIKMIILDKWGQHFAMSLCGIFSIYLEFSSMLCLDLSKLSVVKEGYT